MSSPHNKPRTPCSPHAKHTRGKRKIKATYTALSFTCNDNLSPTTYLPIFRKKKKIVVDENEHKIAERHKRKKKSPRQSTAIGSSSPVPRNAMHALHVCMRGGEDFAPGVGQSVTGSPCRCVCGCRVNLCGAEGRKTSLVLTTGVEVKKVKWDWGSGR